MSTEEELKAPKSGFKKKAINCMLALSISLVIASCGPTNSESSETNSPATTEVPDSAASGDSGDNQSTSGCPVSSREVPLKYGTEIECNKWTFSVDKATLVPNDVITEGHAWNKVFTDRSRVVVSVTLKYTGEGTGDLRDVFPYFPFLLGEKLKTYELDDYGLRTGENLDSQFGPRLLRDVDNPYSGGEVRGALWFVVDNDDRDFVLATNVDDYPSNHSEEPNLWIDVTS
jgi:hypothetical protein